MNNQLRNNFQVVTLDIPKIFVCHSLIEEWSFRSTIRKSIDSNHESLFSTERDFRTNNRMIRKIHVQIIRCRFPYTRDLTCFRIEDGFTTKLGTFDPDEISYFDFPNLPFPDWILSKLSILVPSGCFGSIVITQKSIAIRHVGSDVILTLLDRPWLLHVLRILPNRHSASSINDTFMSPIKMEPSGRTRLINSQLVLLLVLLNILILPQDDRWTPLTHVSTPNSLILNNANLSSILKDWDQVVGTVAIRLTSSLALSIIIFIKPDEECSAVKLR